MAQRDPIDWERFEKSAAREHQQPAPQFESDGHRVVT